MLGAEVVEERYTDLYGSWELTAAVLLTLGEPLETLGFLFSVYAVLSCVGMRLPGARIYVGDRQVF